MWPLPACDIVPTFPIWLSKGQVVFWVTGNIRMTEMPNESKRCNNATFHESSVILHPDFAAAWKAVLSLGLSTRGELVAALVVPVCRSTVCSKMWAIFLYISILIHWDSSAGKKAIEVTHINKCTRDYKVEWSWQRYIATGWEFWEKVNYISNPQENWKKQH